MPLLSFIIILMCHFSIKVLKTFQYLKLTDSLCQAQTSIQLTQIINKNRNNIIYTIPGVKRGLSGQFYYSLFRQLKTLWFPPTVCHTLLSGEDLLICVIKVNISLFLYQCSPGVLTETGSFSITGCPWPVMCSGSQKQNMPTPHLSVIITDSDCTSTPPSTSSITFMEKITLPICALKQDFKYIAVLKNTTHQFKQLLRKSRFLCLNSLIYLRFFHPSGATITSMIFFPNPRMLFSQSGENSIKNFSYET